MAGIEGILERATESVMSEATPDEGAIRVARREMSVGCQTRTSAVIRKIRIADSEVTMSCPQNKEHS